MTTTIPALALRHCETCGHEIPRRGSGQPQYLKRRFCCLSCRRQTGPKHKPKRTACQPVDLSWQPQAACRDEDPELFFSDHHSLPDRDRVARARLICRTCPVKDACLADALATGAYGIWGNTTRDERLAMQGKKVSH